MALCIYDEFDHEFDSLVSPFSRETCEDPFSPAICAIRGFLHLCQAFVHKVLGWQSQEEGLFGQVDAFLGQVHHHGCNGPIFHPLELSPIPQCILDSTWSLCLLGVILAMAVVTLLHACYIHLPFYLSCLPLAASMLLLSTSQQALMPT